MWGMQGYYGGFFDNVGDVDLRLCTLCEKGELTLQHLVQYHFDLASSVFDSISLVFYYLVKHTLCQVMCSIKRTLIVSIIFVEP